MGPLIGCPNTFDSNARPPVVSEDQVQTLCFDCPGQETTSLDRLIPRNEDQRRVSPDNGGPFFPGSGIKESFAQAIRNLAFVEKRSGSFAFLFSLSGLSIRRNWNERSI